ncbi:hypothetical protein N39L_11710 [Limnospira platensis NIES-39]|uniref:Uncharacterized protein n=1 Tax=Limnospira platensis NIES-46 TaxID=1236695 RepID=A0A5M3TA52_LIMPL|nr:hypothetical protein N39L_11710 [Arthrospira platensis NIES-39]GCE95522.1 hypothetical protein NIES46_35880 [Arthrospira platensis NIES-46]
MTSLFENQAVLEGYALSVIEVRCSELVEVTGF